jgi:hypothetical protein
MIANEEQFTGDGHKREEVCEDCSMDGEEFGVFTSSSDIHRHEQVYGREDFEGSCAHRS